MSRYKAFAPVGVGAAWFDGGSEACRLQDGELVEEISLDEAEQIAKSMGEPVPKLSKYQGEYNAAGEREGRGTMTFGNGNVYKGEFKADQQEGHGTYTYADGSTYVGAWQNGKRSGQGTYTFADGTKWVGKWKDDKRQPNKRRAP